MGYVPSNGSGDWWIAFADRPECGNHVPTCGVWLPQSTPPPPRIVSYAGRTVRP